MSDVITPETCDPGATSRLRAHDRDRDHSPMRTVRPLALILCSWAAVALLYWPSALELHRLWTNAAAETYTHGYLIFLLSIWLIVRDGERLASLTFRSEPLALIPLVLLSAAWVWAWRSAIQEAQLLLLPLILYSAVFAAFGRRTARALAFPIGFLYFAMPLWGDINGIVQGLSSKVTGLLLAATGIPAYMSGNLAHLPGGSIEIAGSCSGLHTLIVGLALAAFYGKISDEPWGRRLAWIGVMGALSLMVNWVRIFTVVVAAYETQMRSSLVEHHYWLGWWLFAFVFAGFLWWTGRRPAAPNSAPVRDEHPSTSDSRPVRGIETAPVIVTFATLAVFPVLAYGMEWANPAAGMVQIHWPAAPSAWARTAGESDDQWKPHFVHPTAESRARYTGPAGETVEAFAVAYRVQTQRAKLLGYWNDLMGGTGGLRAQSVRVVNSPAGRWREVVAIDSNGSRSLIWVRYRIGERLFVEPRLSQLWYGLAAIVRPPVSSLTALRTPCHPDCGTAQARLSAATTWLRPVLQ